MSGMTTCDQCGNEYPEDTPGDICPNCLLDGALSLDDDDPDLWLAESEIADEEDRRGETIGPWKLGGKLGEGAFGEVFQVTQKTPVERLGALKIIKSGLASADAVSRFEAERQALARLNHPNIATIFDVGQTDAGLPWYVMELIEGEPITAYCRRKNLSVRERLKIFRTVCGAIHFAHENGIVHRDLKPSNLLVAESSSGEPIVKVIDFGIAKGINEPLTKKTLFTHAGVLIGTLEYMSPEQASGKSLDLDARSDVYSLGVLLYELLTDRTPVGRLRIREAALDESLRMIREKEADRPSTVMLETKLSADLDWIALKALEKDRDRRYSDSGGLGADVERFLSAQPIEARKPSVAYQITKFAGRNRRTLIAATFALLLIVCAAQLGGWWSSKQVKMSPALLAASEFRRTPFPGKLPYSVDLKDSLYVAATASVDEYFGDVARLCRTLRDKPDDQFARYRLWALLSMVHYPERIGDPIDFGDDVVGVVLCPIHELALFACADGSLVLMSTVNGEIKHRLLCGSRLRFVAAPRDGERYVVAVGESGSAFVIDLDRPDTMLRIETGSPISALDVSAKQKTIFCGDAQGKVSAWPIEENSERLWRTELTDQITHLSYIDESERTLLACGLRNGEVHVLRVVDGTPTGTAMPAGGELAGLYLSWKRNEVVAFRKAGELLVWNFETGDYIRRQPLDGGPISSAAMRVSAVVAGFDSGMANVLGMSTDYRRDILTGSAITALDVGNNPLRDISTGTIEGLVRTWTFEVGRARTEPFTIFPGQPINHVAIYCDPALVAAASGSRAQLWSYRYRAVGLDHIPEAGYVTDAAVVDGTDMIRFMGTGGATSFHVESGKSAALPRPIPAGATCMSLSGNGLWMAAAYDNAVRIWKIPTTGKAIPAPERIFASAVTSLDLGPDGTVAAAGTADGGTHLWITNSGSPIWTAQSGEGQSQAASADDSNPVALDAAVGTDLAAFGFDHGGVLVIDLNNGAAIDTGLEPFESPVDALAISSLGTLAIGCRDGTLHLYSSTEGRLIAEPMQHDAGVIVIDFSEDGEWLSSGTRDWFGHHWSAHDGRLLHHTHRFGGDVVLSMISPDGERYFQIGAGNTGGPSVRRIPPHDRPMPAELLDFAEALVGVRIDENGDRQEVPFFELQRIRQEINDLPEDGTRERHWLRWTAGTNAQRHYKREPDW